MYIRTLLFALIALIVFNNVADARKTRRTKRPKNEEDSTPQPNVVTYSTFGFNDVGSYDGFVPSSPDYANYLSSSNQDSSTRLYAPAFPTAMDIPGHNDNYAAQSQNLPSFSLAESSVPSSNMPHYHSSSMSFFNAPGFEMESQNQNVAPEGMFGQEMDDSNAPVYGTKINSRNKNKPLNQFNSTDFNVFNNESPNGEKYSSFHEVHSTQDIKPVSFGESSKVYQNSYSYKPTYSTTDVEDSAQTTAPSSASNSIKYSKFVDFTKLNQYYPTAVENKFPMATVTPPTQYNGQNENNDDYKTKFYNPYKDAFNGKEDEKYKEKDKKPSSFDTSFSNNHFGVQHFKDDSKDNKLNIDYKDKFKYKPWALINNTMTDYKNWKNPLKGYQYSTNFSNTSFQFDFGNGKKPFSSNTATDEIATASSNIIDLTTYAFPERDYSSFKKFPVKSHYNDDFNTFFQSKYNPEDYVRSLYSTVPTTTNHWDNAYKPIEFSSFKHHVKKPQLFDDINDEVVHIPKRPLKHSYGKYSENKPSEWSSFNSYKSYKPKKPHNEWNIEVLDTRFKSEEDLLGLRTHDTSHPSYLPIYRPNSEHYQEEKEYKKLVDKWRQSYLKAKYKDYLKDSSNYDFESYPTESKPIHVPIPKPYPIEVPHPVIVPVPQPYPVRVPVPKPVAVPVIRELTVPIEKPVPYPVIKKVPYPVEKHVPVPVEKEVQVPVIKPYPVPVPHVRPVFHHSRPRDEYDSEIDEDDDYLPRPEHSKRIPYAKRPKTYSTRHRSRRPTRTSYQDRNRRRWPTQRPPLSTDQRRRPAPEYYSPYNHETDDDRDTRRHSNYLALCKRSGVC